MNTILGEIGKTQKFIDLNNQIENKKSPIQILGLTDVGMLQIIGGINEFDKKPICIITYNEIQAKKIYEDIKYFTDKVVLFPKKEIVTYDYIAESKDLPYERIETLDKIISKKNLIIVTTIEAVIQNIPTKETLYKNGQAELDNIGTLYYTMAGVYGFEPYYNAFFSPDLYGLGNFSISPLSALSTSERHEDVTDIRIETKSPLNINSGKKDKKLHIRPQKKQPV